MHKRGRNLAEFAFLILVPKVQDGSVGEKESVLGKYFVTAYTAYTIETYQENTQV